MNNDSAQPLRELPPSDKGKWGRAFASALKGFDKGAMMGFTTGALGMAAFMLTVGGAFIASGGVLPAVASFTAWTVLAGLGTGAFFGAIRSGLNVRDSLKEDRFNRQEREGLINERPLSKSPIIDPELDNSSPRIAFTDRVLHTPTETLAQR